MQQKLSFSDSQGNKLVGILSNPTEDLSQPIIILCHGFSSSKDSGTYLSLEKELKENNISTFRFDFYGHGESDGEIEEVIISQAVDATLNAIELLQNKNYQKIGLLGSSFGGASSLAVAAQSKDLFLLILLAPVSNYVEKFVRDLGESGIQKWKKEGFLINRKPTGIIKRSYQFYEDAKKNNGYEYAPQIKIPTLIIHGQEDTTVIPEQSIKVSSLIPSCQLELIPNGKHTFKRQPKIMEKIGKLVSKFITKNS